MAARSEDADDFSAECAGPYSDDDAARRAENLPTTRRENVDALVTATSRSSSSPGVSKFRAPDRSDRNGKTRWRCASDESQRYQWMSKRGIQLRKDGCRCHDQNGETEQKAEKAISQQGGHAHVLRDAAE
jgi:hypothetical protein